eukprot:988144-Pelagomonas_calceolata.AAC.3
MVRPRSGCSDYTINDDILYAHNEQEASKKESVKKAIHSGNKQGAGFGRFSFLNTPVMSDDCRKFARGQSKFSAVFGTPHCGQTSD